MDAERGRKLTERLFEPDGAEPGAASRVVPGAGSGVEQGVGSNSNSKLLLAALAVGLVLVASAGVGREVVNARALAAQVEEANEARAEAERSKEAYYRFQLDLTNRAAQAYDSGDFDALISGLLVMRDDPSKAGAETRIATIIESAKAAWGDEHDLSELRSIVTELDTQFKPDRNQDE